MPVLSDQRRFALVSLLALVLLSTAHAQTTPEQQAEALLTSAKRAHAEKNYPAALGRFRDYLAKYPVQAGTATARYGVALCLLDGPECNADAALVELTKLLPEKNFTEHPYVLYYAGLSRRIQGDKATDPNVARQHFEVSATHYRDAATAFLARVKEPTKSSEVREWALRSRCDQAEMLLRLGKAKDAREALQFAEKAWRDSRSLTLGLYLHGFASFLLGDHFQAGKALGRTTVLADEVFGTHARYLVGRVHHLNTKQDEREEARLAYQAVLRDHGAVRNRAQEKLNQPADAETKSRRGRLVHGPMPDHVARARFFLGVLQYEDGRFAEALEHLRTFVAQRPPAAMIAEATLRIGSCLVQVKQLDDALRTLQPLADKDPRALHAIGRAHLAKADPKRRETYRPAIEALSKAAGQPRASRGEILADLVEAYRQAGSYKEAIGTCASILDEKLLPIREEELTLSLAMLQQLAGDYAGSDETCSRFLERFKGSLLTPAVLFRHAENAALQGGDATKQDEAAKRFAVLVERYPDSPNAHLARQGMGMAFYRKGDLERAQKLFEAIPAADRAGDLAGVSYALADIYLRQLPARADDAVAAGKMEEKLRSAAESLDAYLAAVPEGPSVPDALLKLGYCHGKMAKLLAQPAEQQRLLMAARQAYERIRDRHRGHPTYPQAMFERAKVLAVLRDVNRGITEMNVFRKDRALRSSAIAPMALVHLATLQRKLNRFADAAATLAECRKLHEETMSKDPARASWVGLVQYHHATALREAGKVGEAQALYEQVARLDRPEGWESALRAGQCRVESASKKVADGRKQPANARDKALADAAQEMRGAAEFLATREATLRERKPATEELQKTLAQVRGRLLYESAWAWRGVVDIELDAARQRVQGNEAAGEVPRQPAEAQARARYEELLKTFPDFALVADARLEYAELLAERQEHDQAVKVLQAALEGEKEPSPELTDTIKLRLASCLLDRGSRKPITEAGRKDLEAALEQLGPLTGNEKSAAFPQAAYREAECHLQMGRLDDAIKQLSRFRDQGPLQRVAGVSDRALSRLGWALGEKKQWDQSRQAYEQVQGRFGGSPWRHEARYGIAWALQHQGRFDEAVGNYTQATGAGATRLSARAQYQVGVCRMAQKRYKDASTAFQTVAAKYPGYPEWAGRALLEAARAFQEDKQREQAVKLLRQVLREHEGSKHAEVARKRLKELGES